MKGPSHLFPSSCSILAMSPLPTPDSPVMSTVEFTEARRFVSTMTLCIAWLFAMTSLPDIFMFCMESLSGNGSVISSWFLILVSLVISLEVVMTFEISPLSSNIGIPVVRSFLPSIFSWIIVISRLSSRTLLATDGEKTPDFSSSSTCLPRMSSREIL